MKKTILGAIVGGLLLFLVQFVNWSVINLHRAAQQPANQQDSILHYLDSHLSKSGSYALPTYADNASKEDIQNLMKAQEGKPWALVNFHKAYHVNLASNLIRNLLVDIVIVWLFAWIVTASGKLGFGKIFLTSLFLGFIIFLNIPYTLHIWYLTPGLKADLIDTLVGWGITGIWLGWWFSRKQNIA